MEGYNKNQEGGERRTAAEDIKKKAAAIIERIQHDEAFNEEDMDGWAVFQGTGADYDKSIHRAMMRLRDDERVKFMKEVFECWKSGEGAELGIDIPVGELNAFDPNENGRSLYIKSGDKLVLVIKGEVEIIEKYKEAFKELV